MSAFRWRLILGCVLVAAVACGSNRRGAGGADGSAEDSGSSVGDVDSSLTGDGAVAKDGSAPDSGGSCGTCANYQSCQGTACSCDAAKCAATGTGKTCQANGTCACVAQAMATTCAGKCGNVTNNCGTVVACPATACANYQSCQGTACSCDAAKCAATGTGKTCQANGTCACVAQPMATTCAGKCGNVTNNCGTVVGCGGCQDGFAYCSTLDHACHTCAQWTDSTTCTANINGGCQWVAACGKCSAWSSLGNFCTCRVFDNNPGSCTGTCSYYQNGTTCPVGSCWPTGTGDAIACPAH